LLRKSPHFIPELSLVAELDGQLVGQILLTKIQIVENDKTRHDSLALAPIAVLPGFQKQGIGGELIKRGLADAAKLGHASVIVLGHEGYYPKFGFAPAAQWGIYPPFEVPSSAFMAVELMPHGLANVSGTVVYPKEFEAV
jgi:putative acetyltransferase